MSETQNSKYEQMKLVNKYLNKYSDKLQLVTEPKINIDQAHFETLQ
jgi:hypothetical protein